MMRVFKAHTQDTSNGTGARVQRRRHLGVPVTSTIVPLSVPSLFSPPPCSPCYVSFERGGGWCQTISRTVSVATVT
jgi:hypothetical protein